MTAASDDGIMEGEEKKQKHARLPAKSPYMGGPARTSHTPDLSQGARPRPQPGTALRPGNLRFLGPLWGKAGFASAPKAPFRADIACQTARSAGQSWSWTSPWVWPSAAITSILRVERGDLDSVLSAVRFGDMWFSWGCPGYLQQRSGRR